MKIYIRYFDEDKEIIKKYRVPIGLFLNRITARIAASALTRDFKKEIIKALEDLKENSALQDAKKSIQSENLIKTYESDDLKISTELTSSPQNTPKELSTEILANVLKNIDNENPSNTINSKEPELDERKYTLNFADGSTVEREISEVEQDKKIKRSYEKSKNKISHSNSELTKDYAKTNNTFSLFNSSEKDLAVYTEKINKLKIASNKEFNKTLGKYRKLYKKQKQTEFKQVFKVLKKSARQNKGLRLVDVQSRDGTIVIIEFW